MPITREILTARLTGLQQQRDQSLANANAAAGAIALLEELLALETPAKVSPLRAVAQSEEPPT